MLKIIIILVFSIYLSADSYAQPTVKDSLKILLKKEKRDTARVNLLAELSFAYSTNSPDTAMQLALEAMSLAQRSGFIKGEALSLNRIGNAYGAIGNSLQAMGSYLKALKLFEKINDVQGTARTLNNIGGVYFAQEEYYQAIGYFLKAIKLRGQPGSGQTSGVAQNNLARSYLALKQYDLARSYSNQAYELAIKNNDHLRTAISLYQTAAIYSETGQNNLALEYYRLSLPYSRLAENYVGLSDAFLGMARLFRKERRMDSTFFYAKKAYAVTEKTGFRKHALRSSIFLSSLFEDQGNSDSAFFYLKAATLAKDSLFNQQKMNQLHNLDFEEKLRQLEIADVKLREAEERKHNLQYAGIAIGLISFSILFFLLSRSIIVKTKFIEYSGVLGLLAVFEFINLFIHPYLAHATDDSPVMMLLVLIVIGAMLVPLHHKLEKWMTKIMVEKNKKIRLEAAKKTIIQLEAAN
jgi:tetratricopeptide (TPR) repeat protein